MVEVWERSGFRGAFVLSERDERRLTDLGENLGDDVRLTCAVLR
jgi:hypothetical protein